MKNYYSLLGLPPTASKEEVKRAYISLAKRYHPDLSSNFPENDKNHAEEMMKEINEAYSVLSDTRKRSLYDEKLKPTLEKRQRAVARKRARHFSQRHRIEQEQQRVQRQNFKIKIDLDLCMGYASCISMYPELFYFDEDSHKKRWVIFYDHAPLRMRNLPKIDLERLLVAAQSCPTKAIIIEDADTGEQIYPFS
jgi:curved DNA-binding protein CbpA